MITTKELLAALLLGFIIGMIIMVSTKQKQVVIPPDARILISLDKKDTIAIYNNQLSMEIESVNMTFSQKPTGDIKFGSMTLYIRR